MSWQLRQVISGGQTGADQAGLRAAKVLGYQTGGMMPHGWKTEAGPRPEFRELYGMTESRYDGYEHRTRFNVRAADATIIFVPTLPGDGGSGLTEAYANALNKLCLVQPYTQVDLAQVTELLRRWIAVHQIRVLNIAGNRESKSPGIGATVEQLLVDILQS